MGKAADAAAGDAFAALTLADARTKDRQRKVAYGLYFIRCGGDESFQKVFI